MQEPKTASLGDELVNGLFRLSWLAIRSSFILLWWAFLFPTLSLPIAAGAYTFFASGWG